ncbi:MAG: hypothetical protein A3G20_01040 [Acidobacteria bacterium RIFCSPLOWO2_12_FULL_59_11]|nr:MAG: hypothetical protein A3G20_01040 [Acidobacteria bacterium RIFCSPLOWO2_12_FULL_59_11]
MAYQVSILPAALRQLAKLPKPVQKRIQEQIDTLTDNPRPHGVKALEGQQGLYRLRVGDYRVIYQIEAERLTVLVVRIGHRREIYRRL